MPSQELRERAVRGAGELFYAEGINATGVARVAETLGMSKRTLYELFGSKEALVTEALADQNHRVRRKFFERAESGTDDPAEQLAAVFVALDRALRRPEFNGCPFLRASAETADVNDAARQVIAEHKESSRRWMERRARSARLQNPRRLSHQLMYLFDGALAHVVAVPDAPAISADTARILIDAARPRPAELLPSGA